MTKWKLAQERLLDALFLLAVLSTSVVSCSAGGV